MGGGAKVERLLRELVDSGVRIFTIDRVREISTDRGDIYYLLRRLTESGWIVPIKRGLYAMDSRLLSTPLHEFEVAMALAKPAAIGFWSALNFHGLSDQIPRVVSVLKTTEHKTPAGREFLGIRYRFVSVRPQRFFGIQEVWIGEARIAITDPERTLLDGLAMPQYFGDFDEVMHAFHLRKKNLDVDKIIDYALRLDVSTAKRLGWLLEQWGIEEQKLQPLLTIPCKDYHKFNVKGAAEGPLNRAWMIQENCKL